MEMNQSPVAESFGKRKGFFVSRGVALLLAILFVGALIITGLLVYYCAPQTQQSEVESNKVVSPSTPAKEYQDVRLPRSLKPLHYTVKLQPLINGNFSILGHVDIEMEVMEVTSEVKLHIADIETWNDTVKLVPSDAKNGQSIDITNQIFDNEKEFYIAELGENLEVGKTYVLSMDFQGYLNDQLRGFYRSSYQMEDGSEKLLATTQFQPTDARRAFPCFDEPGLKATFEVYLARENSMTSISNMPKFETMPFEGKPGWVWDHFNTSVPMSTYLVAFIVSDFEFVSSNANENALFRVWARKSALDQTDYALKTGPEILTFFEKYFDVPFPLPKQDMLAVPDAAFGAMENWGLITYRESALLYDPEISSATNKYRVAVIISHELAHQWFGNLVTPKWWTDLWLNEGFASFVEYLGVNHTEPSWRMMEFFVIEDLQHVFSIDCLESSHPISIPVRHPDEINEIFDRISYAKGASIIRMMNHFLTEDSFRKGLHNYLVDLEYQSAEQDDLWRYLTAAAHEDNTLPAEVTVKEIMDTWTLQMGYPVIKVMRSSDGTSATVTQERFLLVKNPNSEDTHDYKWWVPLSYATQGNPDFAATKPSRWMKDSEREITISSLPNKNNWVIFNVQETGYFRVNYDVDNWNLLIQQLKDDHEVIHVVNRAQIVDDVLSLARAGQVSYDTAMDVNAYLGKETEYIPWSAALSNLGYLKSMFSRASGYGALKNYLLDLLIPLYNSVGFEDNLNDPQLDQYKRVKAITWACKLGHEDCVTNAVDLFKAWVRNPSNLGIVSPNLRSIVYCTAVAEGGEEEWNFAWAQYLATDVAVQKDKLLSAMGCTKQGWILARYLDMAFTHGSGIRKQDAALVFSSVAKNDVGRYLAWRYVREKWNKITDYYKSGLTTLSRIMTAATKAFNTDLELVELELFREQNVGKLGTATRALDQGIEGTKNNMKWMDSNYETILQWLEKNGYSHKLKGQ